jgi:hypothetical protein
VPIRGTLFKTFSKAHAALTKGMEATLNESLYCALFPSGALQHKAF